MQAQSISQTVIIDILDTIFHILHIAIIGMYLFIYYLLSSIIKNISKKKKQKKKNDLKIPHCDNVKLKKKVQTAKEYYKKKIHLLADSLLSWCGAIFNIIKTPTRKKTHRLTK